MKKLIEEIENGIKEREELVKSSKYEYRTTWKTGIGSKSYIAKRIDLLREKLLEEKKRLKI